MEMVQELRTRTSTGMVVETGMDIGVVLKDTESLLIYHETIKQEKHNEHYYIKPQTSSRSCAGSWALSYRVN